MLYIYVLELIHDKYYIGKTTNPDFRLDTHFDIGGSAWTKKFKPLIVIELISGCDSFDEDKYTLKYMEKYGINNVRGGSFCEIKLSEENTNTIRRMLSGSTDKCYICGKAGHFVSECEDNMCYEDVWCCDYCGKEFEDENKCNQHENKCVKKINEDINDLKKIFISKAIKYNKLNNYVIQGDEIIKVFNEIDKLFNFTLNNIYGICQNINKIDELKPIVEYRKGINYLDFIDGFVHIIKSSNSKTTSKSKNNSSSKTNSKTKSKYTCYRCGRKGHKSTECYAKTTYDGDELDSNSDMNSDDEFEEETDDEIYSCDNCGKEYETLKGLTCHQNLYCKKTTKSTKSTKSTKTNSCNRCGRLGHKSTDCYASTHISGKKI